MGIEIVLYSSSPVIQKIFFHLLYHYNPTVHRMDKPSMLIEKVQYSQPDIVFIDDTFSNDLQIYIQKTKEILKDIPIILIAKQELDKQVLESSSVQGVLKKPISAGPLQKLIVNFVPQAKTNIMTKYLKFAPIPTFEDDSDLESSGKASVAVPQDKNTPASSTTQAGSSPSGGIDLASLELDQSKTEEGSKIFSPSDPPSSFSKQMDSVSGIDPVTATQKRAVTEKEPEEVISSAPFVADKEASEMTSDVNEDKVADKEASEMTSDVNEDKVADKEASEMTSDVNEDKVADKEASKIASDVNEEKIEKKEQTSPSVTEAEVKIVKSKWLESKSLSSSPVDTPDKIGTEEHHKKEIKEELDFNTQLKDHINDYVQKWAEEKIKIEVESQLKIIIKEKSQNIIQETAEKAVWQVVPSLAKQLITKELEKLLKEEDGEDK